MKSKIKNKLFLVIPILIAPILLTSFVCGEVIFDGPRSISPDLSDAFTFTVDSVKKYHYTIDLVFNETVLPSYILIVFVTTRAEWADMLAGTKTLHNMTDYLHNQTVYHKQLVSFNITIPDNYEWTFVFYNPNEFEMLTRIKITQEYSAGLSVDYIPLIAIIGFTVIIVISKKRKMK
ncbi:MAG: hypothetical protein FK732_12315 [Asgard group archaeon]|nr:hypothetical protein [Asgard group archaeon]